ncbi:MAG TPA: DUF523 domain-containing protein [Tetragenococcus sp.]|nr:DUF523 domain-containing protein [Tetragenococcus sp.]
MIGISACLGGCYCRYDGKSQTNDDLKSLVEKELAALVCPEVLGGLPIPRDPAEIIGGDGFDVWDKKAQVVTCYGVDVTSLYQQGAKTAYQKLQQKGVTKLILKEASPACGVNQIYDGSFSGKKITGVGVATAYFILKGMTVLSDNEWALSEVQ